MVSHLAADNHVEHSGGTCTTRNTGVYNHIRGIYRYQSRSTERGIDFAYATLHSHDIVGADASGVEFESVTHLRVAFLHQGEQQVELLAHSHYYSYLHLRFCCFYTANDITVQKYIIFGVVRENAKDSRNGVTPKGAAGCNFAVGKIQL